MKKTLWFYILFMLFLLTLGTLIFLYDKGSLHEMLTIDWISKSSANVVSFTDSIPLFAIFFKLFSAVLPSTVQYFGLFVLICFMLQGGFGALLAGLFNKNTLNCILIASIFLLTPVTIEREPKPIRVKNIFICAGVVFCASSRMINALFKVRPRINANGATSITLRSIRLDASLKSNMS